MVEERSQPTTYCLHITFTPIDNSSSSTCQNMGTQLSTRAFYIFSSSFFNSTFSTLIYTYIPPNLTNYSSSSHYFSSSSIILWFHFIIVPLEILRRFRGFLYTKPNTMKYKDVSLPQDFCYVFKQETNLTVLKTSLFFSGDGFTVYNSVGQLVFRLDSYGPQPRLRDQLVLMDPRGRCLLTVRRKVMN